MSNKVKWWIQADGTGTEAPVTADAVVEAGQIVTDILMPGITIEGDALVLSSTALHEMARRIESYAKGRRPE